MVELHARINSCQFDSTITVVHKVAAHYVSTIFTGQCYVEFKISRIGCSSYTILDLGAIKSLPYYQKNPIKYLPMFWVLFERLLGHCMILVIALQLTEFNVHWHGVKTKSICTLTTLNNGPNWTLNKLLFAVRLLNICFHQSTVLLRACYIQDNMPSWNLKSSLLMLQLYCWPGGCSFTAVASRLKGIPLDICLRNENYLLYFKLYYHWVYILASCTCWSVRLPGRLNIAWNKNPWGATCWEFLTRCQLYCLGTCLYICLHTHSRTLCWQAIQGTKWVHRNLHKTTDVDDQKKWKLAIRSDACDMPCNHLPR